MLFDVVRRRVWRGWRVMLVLWFAVGLVTAFLALTPLYVRAVASSELSLRLEALSPADFQLDLFSTAPLDDTVFSRVLAERLGARSPDVKTSAVVDLYMTNGTAQVKPIAYRDFETLFTLVDGALPAVEPAGDVVEAVVTQAAVDKLRSLDPELAESIPGAIFTTGDFASGATVRVRVVGVVNATLPESEPYWNTREDTFGTLRPGAGPGFSDLVSFGLIVQEQAFVEAIASTIDSVRFIREIALAPSQFDAAGLSGLVRDVRAMEDELLLAEPSLALRSGLFALGEDFERSVAAAQRPILFVAVAIAALMLYNIVTTVNLILEQQRTEWAVMSSRGGSTAQLMAVHALTMAVVCVLATLAGPLLAYALLVLLATVGPQAAILDVQPLANMPVLSLALSAAAGLGAALILTLPAWRVARTGLLALKRSSSRPPQQPLWARLYFDVLLTVVGVALLLRLLLVFGGEGLSLGDLLRDPAAVVASVAGAGGTALEDPFNLVGPVLLLAGVALLWMRLFPLLMRAAGLLLARLRGLTVRLAFWNLERDPAHYAQLVLLVIGTLALGTASLALAQTRSAGAWQSAFDEVGAHARLAITPGSAVDGFALPDVARALPLLYVEAEGTTGRQTRALFGIGQADAAAVPETFAPLVAARSALPAYEPGGLLLPGDATRLLLDVYTVQIDPDERVETRVFADVTNADSVTVTLRWTPPEAPALDDFATYSLGMDTAALGEPPYRLTALRFSGSYADSRRFEHVVYLDNLRVETAGGDITHLHSFDTVDDWAREESIGGGRDVLALGVSRDFASDGAESLRLLLSSGFASTSRPGVRYRPAPDEPLPVLVTSAWAAQAGENGVPLQPGDEQTTLLRVITGDVRDDEQVEVTYRVVDVLVDLALSGMADAVLVADLRGLQAQINRRATLAEAYDVDTIYLTLDEREPSATLRAALREDPAVVAVVFAWDRFNALQRDPLANGMTGLLFVGFWLSLGLIVLDFTFYLAVTAQRRAVSYAVLQAMGWESRRILGLLSVEQAAFITPALLVGVMLGLLVAALMLPFLALTGQRSLQIPLVQVAGLLVVLVTAFSVLTALTASRLRRIASASALRTE